jgi:hypothetical protein
MSLIVGNFFSIVTLAFLVVAYFSAAQAFTLGAMSLPCILLATSVIYFCVMPVLAFPDGKGQFLGLYIDSLEWPHLAVGLYALGGVAAAYVSRRTLSIEPAAEYATDRPINARMLVVLATLASLGIVLLVAMGRLNPFGADETNPIIADGDSLRFVNLFLTMIVPLCLVYLVRSNFNIRSLTALGVGTFFILLSGFRYRLIFVAFTVTAAYLMVRRIKPHTAFVLVVMLVGLLGTNFLVNARTRGAGLDLSRIQGMSVTDIMQSFGGEVGPLFSFSNVTNYPIQQLYYFDPWIVGIARLVPSAIWKDKPAPDYLYIPLEGFPVDAKAAGVAIPQQAEILLQFGWIGLPIQAFIYFWIATFILARLSRLGRDVRIAAFALTPIFFGFYMQTRGYFFQTLSDGLFTFGPLFLLHIGTSAVRRGHLSHGHRASIAMAPPDVQRR